MFSPESSEFETLPRSTLGMFAKLPEPGRVKTRLAADWGADRATRLYECFVRDLLDRFSSTADRRVVAFAPDADTARQWFEAAAPNGDWTLWAQPEGDLGQRIARFFDEWCREDFDRTILIGSDSPTIPIAMIDAALASLATSDCVIGPAADGGYWCIGFRGHVPGDVRRSLFTGIGWSTSTVLLQTVERIKTAGLSLTVAAPWYDVDSTDGVAALRGHLLAQSVARTNSGRLAMHYGIADRQYVTNINKARELTTRDLNKVDDPYSRMSLRLQAAFGAHDHVGDIRGRGMFQAIELVADRASKTPFDPALKLHARIKAQCMERGLMVYPMGGTIDGARGDHVLLAPPFIATDADLDAIVGRLADAVQAALVSVR